MCSPDTGSQCTHGKTRLKRRAPAAVKMNAAATPTAGPFDFNKDIRTDYIRPRAPGVEHVGHVGHVGSVGHVASGWCGSVERPPAQFQAQQARREKPRCIETFGI